MRRSLICHRHQPPTARQTGPPLSIFIDECGDFGPTQQHSPFYVLSLVLHDQNDDITGHLDRIHDALQVRGLESFVHRSDDRGYQ